MKKNIILLFIAILLSFKLQCQSSYKYHFINVHSLYIQAKNQIKNNNFTNAIKTLNNIKNITIMKDYNDDIQINLIYAYYKNSDLNMAQKIINEFKELYPQHKHMDYILYLESLIDMKLDQDIYFQYIPIIYYKQDPIHAIKALFQLENIVSNYPHSKYFINATKKIALLKNRLAIHDFQILRYYFSEQEYIAVINRGNEMIKKYPDTCIIQKTLLILEKSYRILHLLNTAEKISKIINFNSFHHHLY